MSLLVWIENVGKEISTDNEIEWFRMCNTNCSIGFELLFGIGSKKPFLLNSFTCHLSLVQHLCPECYFFYTWCRWPWWCKGDNSSYCCPSLHVHTCWNEGMLKTIVKKCMTTFPKRAYDCVPILAVFCLLICLLYFYLIFSLRGYHKYYE